jgi:NAD dependent epimerase/dehydratase family enzyme
VDDWVAMMLWAIDSPSVSGPINATAPRPVTNAEFSKALGRALRRPSWLPAPAFALRILVGEFADEGLIGGQRAVPERAEQLGFHFSYTSLEPALAEIFER